MSIGLSLSLHTAVLDATRPGAGVRVASSAAGDNAAAGPPSAALPLTSRLVAQRRRDHYGFCAFCGAPTQGYACRAHRDLPALDPLREATRRG